MKITFLGTGTSMGVPIIGCDCKVCKSSNPKDVRLRSSVCIEIDDKTFVIDSGPDFRTQLLNNSITHVDSIILTHDHRDHVGGLDDVRAFNFIKRIPIEVYASEQTISSLHNDFSYIFRRNNYPGLPKINLNKIENIPFEINGIEIKPIEVVHYKINIFGFRINNFTYITDASFISEKEMEKIYGTDVLVLNALRRDPYVSHFCLSEALEVIEKVKPKKAYLTHMNHDMGLIDEVNKELPDNVELAYDGLVIEV